MKVTLLKYHNGIEAGEQVEYPDETAQYLIRCGVAEGVKELKASKQTKELKTPKDTK